MTPQLEKFTTDLAKLVTARRKSMNLDIYAAAFELKCCPQHYQRIEAGRVNFKIEMLLRLCHFYGLGLQITETSNNLFDPD